MIEPLEVAHLNAAAYVATRVKTLLTADERAYLSELRTRHSPPGDQIPPGNPHLPDAHLVVRINELLAP